MRYVIQINPLTAATEGFRWSLGVGGAPTGTALVLSSCIALVLLLGGLVAFRRGERTIVDLI